MTSPLKTVVVLGCAYGGARASKMLAASLPPAWRVIVIDRNSHFNHVYVFPRYAVIPSHAPKAYVPYIHMLDPPKSEADKPLTPPTTPPMESHSPDTYGQYDGPEETIEFEYAVYALGASLPGPVNVWTDIIKNDSDKSGEVKDELEKVFGTKRHGVKWMDASGKKFEKAQNILCVGAGALGIQFASDLKHKYPDKLITLLHSRTRVMPKYPIEFHIALIDGLKKLGVEVVLGERVMTWPEHPELLDGKKKVVTTDHGRTFEADLVLPCTGQKPHVALLAPLAPSLIHPVSGRIRVRPTMQVHPGPIRPAASRATTEDRLASLSLAAPLTPPASERGSVSSSEHEDDHDHEHEHEHDEVPDLSHIFACGDCAETGAIQAGHTAYYQSEVAARNIQRLVNQREAQEGRFELQEDDKELENYKVSAPAIKVTMGLKEGIICNAEGVSMSKDCPEDLSAMVMWPGMNADHMDVNE
ncbi:hypothetical protein I317_04720 [Kwoniella heveanensis CBS 569]|uniref:FAD/NAD(P)-binding domain-containing protein n=1 Tax=Kwoniella heveanensis BCC8398 TaxID=1296120 RepID=A0A1B9GZM7_9TREE|nr:hypothetical protein I316_01714 [Kwoniella heveanensis BCC8398]OCF41419.1 hypothetical protein I317_04720 [Kwoniella heveanensis CBS 569]